MFFDLLSRNSLGITLCYLSVKSRVYYIRTDVVDVGLLRKVAIFYRIGSQ